MAGPLITVVNNDTAFLTLMCELLVEEGYQALAWREGANAYEMIRREKPELVILDIRMEQPETGWTILELLRLDPTTTNIPVIVCSADAHFLREKAMYLREKRCDILEKPFDLNDLLTKVQETLDSASSRPRDDGAGASTH
jgi:CheY-like chemotaxis protein